MLELLRVADANGDFHNKWGLRVTVVPGVTGVVCRLTSEVSTSVKEMIVLVTGAVYVLVAAVMVVAALARELLLEIYAPRVKLAQANLGSTMLSINQSKKYGTADISVRYNVHIHNEAQSAFNFRPIISHFRKQVLDIFNCRQFLCDCLFGGVLQANCRKNLIKVRIDCRGGQKSLKNRRRKM
jgi:hypothetical protein